MNGQGQTDKTNINVGSGQANANQGGANQNGANQDGSNQGGDGQNGANQGGMQANQDGSGQANANQGGLQANQDGSNQGGDGQTGANQGGLQANQDGSGKGQDGAPETYADFKLPDGAEINHEQLGEFSKIAKELGLSQAAAQKLVDFQSNFALAAIQEQENAFIESRKAWSEEAKNDAEIGGVDYEKNLAAASDAYSRFASPKLVKFFQDTGLNQHPEVTRLFFKISKLIGEDSTVSGSPNRGGDGKRQFKYD